MYLFFSRPVRSGPGLPFVPIRCPIKTPRPEVPDFQDQPRNSGLSAIFPIMAADLITEKTCTTAAYML